MAAAAVPATVPATAAVVAPPRTCVVLGCGGIGMTVCRRMAATRLFARLVVVVRNSGRVAAEDIFPARGATGGTRTGTTTIVEVMETDLSSVRASKETVAKLIEKIGSSCDALICMAGEGQNTDSTARTIEGGNKVFASNFLGQFIFLKSLLPLLKESTFPGAVIFLVGDQKNYRDIPDIKNLDFKEIEITKSVTPNGEIMKENGSAVSSTAEEQDKATTGKGNKKKSKKKSTGKPASSQTESSQIKEKQPLPSPYSAAKVSLFCVAMELARRNTKMKFALLNPGIVKTNFHKDGGSNIPDEISSSPDEAAALMEWILSPSCSAFSPGKPDGVLGVAKLFHVKSPQKDIPIADSPEKMRFGEHIMDEAAQADLYETVVQFLNLGDKNGNHSSGNRSGRSLKSGSSSGSSRGKGPLSKCLLM